MSVFDVAERSCLIDLSAGAFRPDAPDLANQRWRVNNTRQDVAASCLMSWGVVSYDREAQEYRLSTEGIARARLTALEMHRS